MRIFVSALFVASSIAVGIAQVEPGPGQQPGARTPQPGAQQPSTQPPAPREPSLPKPQTSQTSKMTISGCIQSAPAAAGGGAAGGAASAQEKFILANAKPAGGAAGAAVGTAGSAATRYQLEGEEKTISPHLNHQVEITGTVQPAAGGAAAGGAAAAPMLKVESVKMVAAKCS
jgi:hypothetical protein